MKLSIVVVTPKSAEGKVIPINVPQFLIGRDPTCQLRPASIHISKRHCALLRREDKVFIRDFGSTNGTFVNDRQIRGEIELLDGDELRVGPLVFAVRLESAPVDRQAPVPSIKTAVSKQASGPVAPPPLEQPAHAAGVEDDAAATLLAMQEGDSPESGPRTDVPEGSTVMDLPTPILAEKEAANKEKEKPKASSGDTSTAAKSILDKYLKRPR